MDRCIIYLLKNTVNEKVYVGQTWSSLKSRWNSGYNYCRHLKNAMTKHGVDSFYYQIVDFAFTQWQADCLETNYIKFYDATNPQKGYNILAGGANSRRSKNLREKVAMSCRGINSKIAEEVVIKIFNDPGMQQEIAQKYQVDQTTIADIKNGRSWSWLTGKMWANSRLDDNIVLSIFNEMGTHKNIAKKYNTTRQTVGNIKRGIVYSHLTGKTCNN